MWSSRISTYLPEATLPSSTTSALRDVLGEAGEIAFERLAIARIGGIDVHLGEFAQHVDASPACRSAAARGSA